MKQNYLGLKTSFCLFSISLCVLFFLTSCSNGPIPPTPPVIDKSGQTPGPISENLVARIYFDATLSMQGYVIPGATRYTQMCRYLESVIVSGWENATVDFFRFGEEVEPIDRNTYLNLSRPGFYENSSIFRKTFIQKIIDHEAELTTDEVEESVTTEESTETATIPEDTNNSEKGNPLVVIVTDLFQDNRDLTVLVTQIKKHYIQKGYEVGLLGLRSEFDGTVYDLGDSPLPYSSTTNNPETYRPFYLLVIGRHADISHYFDRLMANGFAEAETVLFSRYLVNPLLSFENVNPEVENLIRDRIAEEPDPRVKEYRITRNNNPSQISAILKFQFLSHVMPFATENFEVSIVAKNKPDPDGQNEISLDAQECMEVTSTLSNNGDKLSIDINLDSGALPDERMIYLYEVTLSPGTDTFKEPDWCSQWDMGDERNGAKTLNLVNFVRGLSQATALIHEPIIAKFHFYIEKR